MPQDMAVYIAAYRSYATETSNWRKYSMHLLNMYALTAVILTFKMFAVSIVQGRGRLGTTIYTVAEDAELFGGKLEAEEAPSVQRASNCWRNDLENIPMFLILAGIYVAAGLSAGWFSIYCVTFLVMRILHTFFYLNAVQPWRTVVFTIGAVAMFAMAIHLLVQVAFA
jgi:glutathione S-transferase